MGRTSLAIRSTNLPGSDDEFVRYSCQYLDARPFAVVPKYAREKKNARKTSCYNRCLHLPGDVRSVARCRALICPEMPYTQCEEEEDYQWRVNKLLSDLYMLHGDPRSSFSPGEHNHLGLMCFKPPYDQLYWITNRVYGNDMIEPDGRIRTKLKFFFCLHQVEFHDTPPNRRPSVYLHMQMEFFNKLIPLPRASLSELTANVPEVTGLV